MQFKNIVLLASATSVLAAPAVPIVDVAAPAAPVMDVAYLAPNVEFGTSDQVFTTSIEGEDKDMLEESPRITERQLLAGAVIGALAPVLQDIATKASHAAIEQAGIFIRDLRNWKAARSQFTQTTVREMWQRNPDPERFPAAVCYNKGYHLERPEGIDGWTKVELRTGLLHTDYDCMYMESNNNFYTWSDGGYINFAFGIDKNRCDFDHPTGDILCP